MADRMRPQVKAASVALLIAVAASGSPVAGAPSTLDAKRREAARIEAEIARRGERLSIAAENYNEAALSRSALDGKLSRLQRDLEREEKRWGELKVRLGQRARFIYMHPGGWALSWLEPVTLNEFARAQVFAGTVLATDTDLLLQTQRARAEIEATQAELERSRREARAREKVLAAKRAEVEKALREERALLAEVRGEIAELIAVEQRRRLADAARRAARSGSVAAPKYAGPVRSTAARAVASAAAQIGKPYEWGASGPDAFDCSGLTAYAWASAGVSLPHSSRAQYGALPRVGMNEIQPGDLLFYGSPVHHVGIYEGGGVMINAPQTGESVRRSSIYRSDFAGAGRP